MAGGTGFHEVNRDDIPGTSSGYTAHAARGTDCDENTGSSSGKRKVEFSETEDIKVEVGNSKKSKYVEEIAEDEEDDEVEGPGDSDIELISLTLIQRKKIDKNGNIDIRREQHINTSLHYDQKSFPWQDFMEYFLQQVAEHMKDVRRAQQTTKIRVADSETSDSEPDE